MTMTDRDRLAADLLDEYVGIHDIACETQPDEPCDCADTFAIRLADRLIALGWTRLDEERLARAFRRVMWGEPNPGPPSAADRDTAAAIAKAYREDTDGG